MPFPTRSLILIKGSAYMAVVSILLAIVGACTAEAPSEAGHSSGFQAAPQNSEPGTQDVRAEIASFLDQVPLQVTNDFARSSVSKYDEIPPNDARLDDHPFNGKPARSFVYSFLGLSEPVQVVERARLAFRGEVVAIGRPYFNSTDGGFWHPALHDEPGVVDTANRILRDVLVKVTEVWGNRSNIQPGEELSFASIGGQVQVVLDDEKAEKMEVEPGSYIYSAEPPVNLSVGEEALLFLDQERLGGLYNGRYGYKFVLYPAHERYYKYRIEDGTAVNAGAQSLTLPVDELRKLVAQHLGDRAGPQPRPGVFPKEPHPPVSGSGEGAPSQESVPPHQHGEE